MRIAYLINSVEGGGASAPVPAICHALERNGAEVAVFALTGRDRRGLHAIAAAGVPVRVRNGGETDHAAALRWLTAELTAWKPDLLWTSLTRATLLGQIVAGRLGLPVVSWQHAAYLKPANRLLLRLRQARSALWISDSECVARLTRARLAVPQERLLTWPLFAVDETAPRAAAWQRGEPVRIGSLGRLHRVKGYDVLLQALSLLPDNGMTAFELVIAGDGAERTTLQQMIERLGLTNVRLAGFTPGPRHFLAGLHLYVQPSRSEGMCIAAHEAMQAGLPIVASAVGEMPFTIVDGRTGYTVPPADPAALAAALRSLLERPERLPGMGAASRHRVHDRFSQAAFDAAGDAIMHRVRSFVRA